MSDKRFRDICRAAVEKWGIEAQIDMVIEECGELIVALQQRKRKRIPFVKVIEEGVDVEIMLGQLKYIYYPDPEWKEIREQKLKHLEEKLGLK